MKPATLNSQPIIGVTVLPEYLQSETVERVLDRLQAANVNAVTTSPYVMAPADEASGSREPPIDANAGSVRLLDRPLWGKRELWVRTSPSFEPDKPLYDGLRYQPPEPDDLTRSQGALVERFVESAARRGMKVYFQVQAAIPPGYRVQFGGPLEDDQPRLPDGGLANRRVSKNGSLASEQIVAYGEAMLKDLCWQYPNLTGVRIDWPEHPPYLLETAFFDFSECAREAAARMGFDFELIHRDALQLWRRLHGALSNDDLAALSDADGGRFSILNMLSELPGVALWLRFKAALVEELLGRYRAAMNAAGGEKMELIANAFPPPWSLASGFNFHQAAQHCQGAAVKLYGMHWSMMLRFYADSLLQTNEGLDEALLVETLARILDIHDESSPKSLDGWRYPAPDEPHQAPEHAQVRKIRQAQLSAGRMPIFALAHSYGPADDFHRRFLAARRASNAGVWINRYGYLSDEKLSLLRQATLS